MACCPFGSLVQGANVSGENLALSAAQPMRTAASAVLESRSSEAPATAWPSWSITLALAAAPALAVMLALGLAWELTSNRLVAEELAIGRLGLGHALAALAVLVAIAAAVLGAWLHLAVCRPLQRLCADPLAFRPEDVPLPLGRLATLPMELALLRDRLRQAESRSIPPDLDRLTGLLTVSGLIEAAGVRLETAGAAGGQLTLVIVDVRQLRDVNASHGHAVGDELLRQQARRLAAVCPAGSLLARVGGDRFGLLLPLAEGQDDHGRWPRAILAALRRPYCIEACELQVEVAVGAARYPEHGTGCQALLRAADLALEAARRGDGRQWCEFDPRLNQMAVQQRTIERDLRLALEQKALTLHYQPQIDLLTGKVLGVEALLRWPHPEKGMIPPQSFIPVAEASGLIRALGAWVLVEATQAARRWHQQGLPVSISVNVSPAQLRRHDLVRLVEQVLVSTGLPPAMLELELTESMFVDPTQIAMHRTIQGLAGLGVRLAIDDFGTGYSSLGYLKRLPVEKIKIDKSFVRELGSSETDAAIVRSIIALARIFGKRVLAEGVEEAGQARFLRAEGCDEAQGYYYARPMPEAACTTFLQRQIAGAPAGQALAS